MKDILFVGGTFDKAGGRSSGLIQHIYEELCDTLTSANKSTVVQFYNGGFVDELHNVILPSVVDYGTVLWFANVPNDEVKIRDVKAINPRVILITSKRNDNEKYSFAELISRSLAIKANLTLEFSKWDDKIFNMRLFDPLGNIWYDGLSVIDMCRRLVSRLEMLESFTRVPSVLAPDIIDVPKVPEETEFFEFAHSCADIFHNLINPAKGTERFLGNMSFRCQNGFPSFRGDNGLIYVSKRNVDKSEIQSESFVPTYLDSEDKVRYFGENKPSVDTPIQLKLYKMFPWANYMIHAHCYTNVRGIQGAIQFRTSEPIPCGAVEEVDEILKYCAPRIRRLDSDYNEEAAVTPRVLAVNLQGHGSILIIRDLTVLKDLMTFKDNCFIERPIPEAVPMND